MAESDDKLGIKLDVAGHQMSITIPRDMEELYRRAGKYINQRINVYANMYPDRDKDQFLRMAIIDIALAHELSEVKNDTQPYELLLAQLNAEIEEVLEVKQI